MNSKRFLFSILIGLGCGVAGVFATPALLLAPAFLAYLFAAWGLWYALFALAAALAAGLGLGGAEACLSLFAAFVPASLAIGLGLKGNKPYRTMAVTSALALGASLYVILCLGSILAGEDPFFAVGELMAAVGDTVFSMAEALQPEEAALDAVRLTIAQMKDGAAQLAMAYVCAGGMLFGLVDTVVAQGLCKKAGLKLRPMAPMPLWQLSRNYTWASFAALAGALAVLLLKLNNADAVFMAAECVVLGPLALMGLCFLDFLTRLGRPGGRGRRVVLYAGVVLLLPYSVLMLSVTGLVDRFMKLRARYRPNQKKTPPGDNDPS